MAVRVAAVVTHPRAPTRAVHNGVREMLSTAVAPEMCVARSERGVTRVGALAMGLGLGLASTATGSRSRRSSRRCQKTSGQYLIGEELVTDDDSASELADRCIDEAYRILYSTDGWQQKRKQDGVVVEASPVIGPYAQSGVDIVRGVSEYDCSADEFFNFQISKLGMQATDEFMGDNHRNVDVYNWAEQPATEKELPNLALNRVEWRYPFKTREFVSLDLFDCEKRVFVSKSCLHRDRPGGSKYQDAVGLDERDFVRAVQYYAVVVDPISETLCRVRMASWGEMCDSYSAFWVNKFNADLFITPKFERFRKCLSLQREGGDVEAFLVNECSRDIADVVLGALGGAPSLLDRGSDFFTSLAGQRSRKQTAKQSGRARCTAAASV